MIEFRPARPKATNVLAGLGGGTGSGKTFSGLLLATGLVAPSGRIAVVDTERGRALHYARRFRFDHAELEPPFTPERYMAMIDAAGRHVGKGGVVIVDSMSHEWEGEGGLLEDANRRAQSLAAKYNSSPDKFTFMSWRDPKERHQRELIAKILKVDFHLVLCFRAKEKLKMMKVKDGSQEITKPVSIGIQPIAEGDFGFEMTFFAIFDQANPGVPSWTHKWLMEDLHPVFPAGKRIDEATGRRLAEWAAGSGEATETNYWVNRDGIAVGGLHARISSALFDFDKLWSEDKDRYSHYSNLNLLKEYLPKIPDGPAKIRCDELIAEMTGILDRDR